MIRDPSDGSVKSAPASVPDLQHRTGESALIPVCVGADTASPVIETSTSGLRMTKAQAEYRERLNNSREWLKEYHAMRASNGTEKINMPASEAAE